MAESNSRLTIRAMRGDDLDVPLLFNSISRENGKQWFERQGRSEFYVAVAELGTVPVARLGMDYVSYAEQDAAYLFSAHVEQDFQSRGIGTALFLHMEPIALKRGFDVMVLQVGKDNVRAQRLYERFGYEIQAAVIGRWSYHDEERLVEVIEDNWLMQKRLVASPR